MARHKFFSVISAAYILVGCFALPMALDTVMRSSFENIWRTVFAFMLFAGALQILFVAMRQQDRFAGFRYGLFALFEGMLAFCLVASKVSFAELSPGDNPSFGLIAIGILLIVNGGIMVRTETRKGHVGPAPTYG